ncbi:arginine/ornithine antiporter ArcD [Melissococcus plutonius]|uniref:Arginine/ornithine antiporter ArcD n=1 Tax=Melissococcus plutonius (strain ATCC 35311 / DSM 29964 / CIP 104052 / LMG 20360 / NCIMB 702443) TaxID=940190 RepID=F3YAL8_MELPT|nr:YfcC family protein [Melissococcus plutonius]AIM25005.1 arginine/ornithine antiporter ArcD [Melissococcus plutonius S1]KMT25171.1 arginine/ornithine antiporter ArcD [Melissococcus plutonius]KMT26077.1 arginine/ornithine antiporter ArcD [Melissococcus plutonius]KMT26807.1 arginine/ornithine antiporter ArcD [Melissococcus plutonius]KMT28819.1 arginine/ornithine antiporter ArcD [Melissococcus plutonius]
MANKQQKEKKSLSSFSILFIILILLTIVSWIFSGQKFSPTVPAGGTEKVNHVVGARLSDLVMSPFNGFRDAIDICVFVLILGGFLNIVTKTGALEAGIQHVVRRLKGNELVLIPILMFLFSIGGSTYGMSEETIPFYSLLAVTMVASGFDTIVSAATVMLGAGAGVIGSTINPFATGVAMDALKSVHIKPDTSIILMIGVVLWLVTTGYCIFYVMKYARKVKADKGSTILSLQEQEDMDTSFSQPETKEIAFTNKRKLILTIFAFAFAIMVVALIPWESFNVTIFKGWTAFLTGQSFGNWYFGDLAMWFFLISLIISIIYGLTENEIVETFIVGSKDILSVVLIIVVARGASIIMQTTHLDLFILDRSANILQGFSPILFVIGAYILYLFLSILIPSTSGLAYVSIPVMGALANHIGLNASVMIMIFTAGCGLINLITPTSGVVMGGLQMSKIDYSTWMKFMIKPLVIIGISNLIILIISILLV